MTRGKKEKEKGVAIVVVRSWAERGRAQVYCVARPAAHRPF